MRLRKLNQLGFDHMVVGALFAVVIGIGGTYYLMSSHANPWSGAFELGSNTNVSSNYCMGVKSTPASAVPVVLNKCSSVISQKWELTSAGTTSAGKAIYLIETDASGSNMCVDNWYQSKIIGNALKLYSCNSSDPAQRFIWSGTGSHQLQNIANGLCIDDYYGSTAANNTLDMYTCKKTGMGNQEWFEVANSAATTSSGGSGNGGGSSTSTPPPTTTSSSKVLGFYDGNHQPATVETAAKWLGSASDVQYALEFLDDTSWSTISDPSWFLSQWSGTPYTMIWGVPMVPCGAPSTSCSPNSTDFDAVANGSENSYYKTLAQNLVTAGQGSSYIRLGWEFQGDWFPWSTCNSDGQKDFVPAFQNIVTTMRAVSPNFKFIWNPDASSNTSCSGQLENYYPGDSYVNDVALDVYDTNGGSDTSTARWTDLLNGVNSGGWTATTPQSISGQSFSGYGLSWLAAFAKEHNKQVSLPEWGLWNDGSSAGGGDDTYFIDQMSNWVKSNATGPAVYWDNGQSALTIPSETTSSSPNATAEFKKDFAGY